VIGYLTYNPTLISAFQPHAPAAGRARRETAVTRRVFKMAPKISDLLPDSEIITVRGSLDRPISGLVMDSRRVVPGTLFFALPGRRADGASFVDEAIARGAVGVVTSRLPAAVPARVTFIQVADPRVALARVAQRFYRFPAAGGESGGRWSSCRWCRSRRRPAAGTSGGSTAPVPAASTQEFSSRC